MTKKLLTISAILLLTTATTAFGNRYHRDSNYSHYRNNKQNFRYYKIPVRNRRTIRKQYLRKQIIHRRVANTRRYHNKHHYNR